MSSRVKLNSKLILNDSIRYHHKLKNSRLGVNAWHHNDPVEIYTQIDDVDQDGTDLGAYFKSYLFFFVILKLKYKFKNQNQLLIGHHYFFKIGKYDLIQTCMIPVYTKLYDFKSSYDSIEKITFAFIGDFGLLTTNSEFYTKI